MNTTTMRNARKTDPFTSKMAAAEMMDNRPMARRLLIAYADAPYGLNTDEAAKASGLHARSGVWKRISDLHRDGMIMYMGSRPGDSGREQQVGFITPDGEDRMAMMRETR